MQAVGDGFPDNRLLSGLVRQTPGDGTRKDVRATPGCLGSEKAELPLRITLCAGSGTRNAEGCRGKSGTREMEGDAAGDDRVHGAPPGSRPTLVA